MALRNHYMLGFSVAALAVAAYGASGGFESDPDTAETADRPVPASVSSPTPGPAAATNPRPLVVTYFLVGSEEHRALLHGVEDQLTYREYLSQAALEVLVVQTPAEETEALRIIDDARTSYPFTRFLVVDLR
jgi:hypothetical protein